MTDTEGAQQPPALGLPSAGSIKAHPDSLRAVAGALQGVLGEIDSVLPALKELGDAVVHEASNGTIDGSPAPQFSPLLEALGTANGKVTTNVEQLRSNVARDAEILLKLADSIDGNEQANAARIANI